MGKPLRALLVEGSERDAEALLRELQRGGFDVASARVDTAEAMRAALDTQAWEIILCEYHLPHFDAQAAYSLMRDRGLDLPFIIISGTVGEDAAVEAMRAGVHDYFVKDKLGPRLVVAIEREIREAAIRAERKKMQEQLLFSDRMVSMGTLAAGVAHEINNPLASLMANLELVSLDVAALAESRGLTAAFSEVREELSDAREASERIRNIVRDLKIFSRSSEDKKEAVDVKRVLDSTLRMAWNEIRHRAQLVRSYGEVPPVEAGESRLGQVFLNLVINAAQAIKEGCAESNEIRVATSTDPAGRVIVEIGDTGSGMPAEVLARLFTPFFTTKPVGVGTGLGLSICQRIVTDLGGSIDVHSEVGKGSVFRIALPPAPAGLPVQQPPTARHQLAARRRGKILVVDDEPMILRVVQRALAPEHDVVAVTSAGEALQKIVAGERFDVVLCDLMMPQMTGMDLHARLCRVADDQASRMIFLTGGAFTPLSRAFLDEVPNQRVDKPFDTVHLRALVNDRVRLE